MSGKIEKETASEPKWIAVPEYSWVDQVFKLLRPDAKAEPDKYSFVWLSELPRAADVLLLARRMVWEGEFENRRR
ncbi:hypothetical protein [Lysobacter fragariae]